MLVAGMAACRQALLTQGFPNPRAVHLLYDGKTIMVSLLPSLQPSLFTRGLIKRFCGQLFPVGQFSRK